LLALICATVVIDHPEWFSGEYASEFVGMSRPE